MWINLDKITNILGNGIEIQGFYGISLELNRMDSSHIENMQLHEGPMRIALLGIPLITAPQGFPWLPSCSLRPSLRIAISCEHFFTSPQPGLTEDDRLTPVTLLSFLLCKLSSHSKKIRLFCLSSLPIPLSSDLFENGAH